MDYLNLVRRLHKQGKFEAIDVYFAEFAVRFAGEEKNSPLLLAAALVSQASSSGGSVCLPKSRIADGKMLAEYLQYADGELLKLTQDWLPDHWPPVLIDDGEALYLAGNFNAEELVLNFVREAVRQTPAPESELDFTRLTRLPLTAGQQSAVRQACRSSFLVVSGGPGTGKTTIVSTVLALRSESPDSITLCAPTGKAQSRMQESLAAGLDLLLAGEQISADRVEQLKNIRPQTIDRLLGNDGSGRYRFNHQHPLACSLIVIDEGSMISLAMLAALFDALKPGTAVILLGDRAQLASVEPGVVFADLCELLRKESPQHLAMLTESKRFASNGGIARLRDALELPDNTEESWKIICAGETELAHDFLPDQEPEKFLSGRLDGWFPDGKPYYQAETLDQAWESFNELRLLTPYRSGRWGVEALNGAASQLLGLASHDGSAPGEARMVTVNNYLLNVFNGDTGMLWFADGSRQPLPRSQGDTSHLLLFFPQGKGKWLGIEPELLPDAVPAYALTIHKSQGSDYGKVMIFLPALPPDGRSLLSCELLYTAITRARKQSHLVCNEPEFKAGAAGRISRFSGLKKRSLT